MKLYYYYYYIIKNDYINHCTFETQVITLHRTEWTIGGKEISSARKEITFKIHDACIALFFF